MGRSSWPCRAGTSCRASRPAPRPVLRRRQDTHRRRPHAGRSAAAPVSTPPPAASVTRARRAHLRRLLPCERRRALRRRCRRPSREPRTHAAGFRSPFRPPPSAPVTATYRPPLPGEKPAARRRCSRSSAAIRPRPCRSRPIPGPRRNSAPPVPRPTAPPVVEPYRPPPAAAMTPADPAIPSPRDAGVHPPHRRQRSGCCRGAGLGRAAAGARVRGRRHPARAVRHPERQRALLLRAGPRSGTPAGRPCRPARRVRRTAAAAGFQPLSSRSRARARWRSGSRADSGREPDRRRAAAWAWRQPRREFARAFCCRARPPPKNCRVRRCGLGWSRQIVRAVFVGR